MLLAQIDIEGFEYEVFADMTEADDATLPRQVGGLLHCSSAVGQRVHRPGALSPSAVCHGSSHPLTFILPCTNARFMSQIGVEFHFQLAHAVAMNQVWQTGLGFPTGAWTSSHMSLAFLHMANLGYAPIFREDNPWENLGCCAEFTFLKVEATNVSHPEAGKSLPATRRALYPAE